MDFPVVLVGIVVSLLTLAIWAIYTQRKQTQAKRAEALALGFAAVPQPGPRLVEQIAGLYRRLGNRKYKLSNVFHRRMGDYDVYLFDLQEIGTESGAMVENGVAVISTRFNLPYFGMAARIQGVSKRVNFANQMIGRWMLMMMPLQISFPNCPEFDQKFWVTAEDETAARALLTPELIQRFEWLTNIQILAGRDIFTYANHTLRVTGNAAILSPIRDLVNDAVRAGGWFEDANT